MQVDSLFKKPCVLLTDTDQEDGQLLHTEIPFSDEES